MICSSWSWELAQTSLSFDVQCRYIHSKITAQCSETKEWQ